ncbi:MAG: hypothetical protein IMX04_08875 [Candidatus Carbobacillus altaicus]|nr:hypothetical protein [Candidatus Carbobacillus altaicus]
MENLDVECAKLGEELAELADAKLLTDALAVLQEQGLYAFFLYLKVQKEKGEKIKELCTDFLEKTSGKNLLSLKSQPGYEFELVKTLAANLDDLLFARDLLLQAIMYGRYHAKVKKEA